MISKNLTSLELNSDVAVIGSGPVGLYLSLLLAKRGFKVVIIEAGGLGIESSHLNQTKYLFNTPSSLPKNAHMFGGGGNLWFRRIGEFLKRDFLPVSGVREECWPIEFDQLSVYASEVFQYFTGSPLRDSEIEEKYVSEAGLELPSIFSLRVHRSFPVESMLRLKDEVMNSPNIHILCNTYCAYIEPLANLNGSDTHALAVINESGQTSKIYANKVVVSAGALQSVALLERSISIVNPQSKAVLGKYLMEHLEGFVGFLDFKFEESRDKFLDQFSPRYLVDSAEGLVGAGLSFQPEILDKLKLSTFHLEFYGERIYPIIEDWDFLFLRKIGFAKIFDLINRLNGLLYKGFVRFRKSRYRISVWIKAEEIPFSHSKTSFESKSNQVIYEHIVSRHSASLMRKNLKEISPGLEEFSGGKFRIRPRIRIFNRWLKMRPNWHPSGSLRMGVNSKTSVCNENFEVWGTSGVHILNSGIFPTGSNANPVFMSWLLAHRLADYLKKSTFS